VHTGKVAEAFPARLFVVKGLSKSTIRSGVALQALNTSSLVALIQEKTLERLTKI